MLRFKITAGTRNPKTFIALTCLLIGLLFSLSSFAVPTQAWAKAVKGGRGLLAVRCLYLTKGGARMGLVSELHGWIKEYNVMKDLAVALDVDGWGFFPVQGEIFGSGTGRLAYDKNNPSIKFDKIKLVKGYVDFPKGGGYLHSGHSESSLPIDLIDITLTLTGPSQVNIKIIWTQGSKKAADYYLKKNPTGQWADKLRAALAGDFDPGPSVSAPNLIPQPTGPEAMILLGDFQVVLDGYQGQNKTIRDNLRITLSNQKEKDGPVEYLEVVTDQNGRFIKPNASPGSYGIKEVTVNLGGGTARTPGLNVMMSSGNDRVLSLEVTITVGEDGATSWRFASGGNIETFLDRPGLGQWALILKEELEKQEKEKEQKNKK